MPRLLVEPPNSTPITVELRDGLTAGRNEAADIVLLDPQVSRNHLRFRLSLDGECVVRDLESAHGTLVNGTSIKSHILSDGDVIQIGNTQIKFADPPEASIILKVKDTLPALGPPNNEAALRLRIFYDLARAISQSEDIDALLGRILDSILDALQCERGVAGIYDANSPPDYLRRIVRVRGAETQGSVIISSSLIDATLKRQKAVIARDFKRTGSFIEQNILTAMAAPLLSGPHVLGFLYVDDRGSSERFADRDIDFLSALAHILSAAVESAQRYQRALTAAVVLSSQSPLGELIGDSQPMRRLKIEIKKYGASPTAHVMIRGESGTGKELVARTLHALSPRAGMPLVTLNCAAMPETMIENELFGHVKGAFTGATSDKRGKFVLADEGTLFLDEIGDLSLAAQAKVLRAVQEGEVQPLGSEKTLRVNVRILSATHKDLAAEVAAGRFREDLFYRLNVLELEVPPLRERAEDIPRLAHIFLMEAAKENRKRVAGFTPQAIEALARYRFPGNVRELQNEAQKAAILVEGGSEGSEPAIVDIGDLSSRIRGAGAQALDAKRSQRSLADLYTELNAKEKAIVEEALLRAKGNIAEAARLLALSRSMMLVRMKRFGLGSGEPD